MLVYLCGPIDQCTCDEEVFSWRKEATNKLIRAKFNVFDAASAFTISNRRQNYNALYDILSNALIKSNLVFANIPKTFTVGTFVELHIARENGIPVYAVIDASLKNSMTLSALLSRHGKWFSYWDDAINMLISNHSGEAALSDE